MTLDWETTRRMLAESLGLSEEDLGASKQEEETEDENLDLYEESTMSELEIIESEFEEDVFETILEDIEEDEDEEEDEEDEDEEDEDEWIENEQSKEEGPAFLMLPAEEQEKEIKNFIKSLDDSIESENNIISPFVTGALALCIGTFILALAFSMIKMFNNRKTTIRTLIVFSGLIAVFIISYLLNSDQATTLETNVSTALTSLWILLGLSVLAIIYSEITKLFSR